MRYLGCHLSASNGNLTMVRTAQTIGANTFAFFTRKKPCVFFRLGTTNPDDPSETSYPVHNVHFDVDERCFEVGIPMFVNFVLDNQDGIEF